MNLLSLNYFEVLEKELICYLLEGNNYSVEDLLEDLKLARKENKGLYEIIPENLLISFINAKEENFVYYSVDKEANNYVIENSIGSGDTVKELLENVYVLENFVYFMNNYKIYKIEEEYYLLYLDN